MSANRPDPHYYPKQYRHPKEPAAARPTLHPKQSRPLWKHPLYLALWERLPNKFQIPLLEYEARLDMWRERRYKR